MVLSEELEGDKGESRGASLLFDTAPADRIRPAHGTSVSAAPMADSGGARRLLSPEEIAGARDSAATEGAPPPPQQLPCPWALRALGRRRTWVALFLLAYAALLSASWRLLLSIRSWYGSALAAPSSAPWPALYASVLCGGVFGLLSMAAALAVALPAMVVTWITVLVLLACAGKPQWALVREGRRATADIAGIALRVLVREGNVVAAICAVVSFAALVRYRERNEPAAGSR